MTTRVDDAVAIRDHVVSLARSDGTWVINAGLPELVWRRARWVARFSSSAELVGPSTGKNSSPNRLVIADRDRVIFRVEWSLGGPIRVMIFDRGAWEGKLLALPCEI